MQLLCARNHCGLYWLHITALLRPPSQRVAELNHAIRRGDAVQLEKSSSEMPLNNVYRTTRAMLKEPFSVARNGRLLGC